MEAQFGGGRELKPKPEDEWKLEAKELIKNNPHETQEWYMSMLGFKRLKTDGTRMRLTGTNKTLTERHIKGVLKRIKDELRF